MKPSFAHILQAIKTGSGEGLGMRLRHAVTPNDTS